VNRHLRRVERRAQRGRKPFLRVDVLLRDHDISHAQVEELANIGRDAVTLAWYKMHNQHEADAAVAELKRSMRIA